MMGLGLGAGSAPSADVRAGFRVGWLKHVSVALGGASGAAVVLGAYEVLRSQPNKAFELLESWGPYFLISIVALFVGGKFLEGLNQTIRDSFGLMASGIRSSAEAAGRTADALTRLADQGTRQAEEVSRLAIYAAREFPAVYERFDQLDASMRELVDGLKGLHWAVNVKAAHMGEGSNERGT